MCMCNRIIENKATTCSRCDTQPMGIFSDGADGTASFRLQPGLVASELNTVTHTQKHTRTFTNTRSEARTFRSIHARSEAYTRSEAERDLRCTSSTDSGVRSP